MDEPIVTFGSAVKDLGNGRVGGHLVLFGSPTVADLDREFFTKATDFEIEDGAAAKIRYHHGRDKTIGRRILGKGVLRTEDVGVWIEGQLDLRDAYEQAIYQLVKAGKLGWSSGSLPQFVSTKTAAGSTREILSWPLGEDASLTPIPCDPRNSAVPLKSLAAPSLEELLAALVGTAPAPAAKAATEEPARDEAKPAQATEAKAAEPPADRATRPGTPEERAASAKGMFDAAMAKDEAGDQIYELVDTLRDVTWTLIYRTENGEVEDPAGELDRIVAEFSAAYRSAVAPALASDGVAKSFPSGGPHGGLRLGAQVERALAAAHDFIGYGEEALERIQVITKDRAAEKAGRAISQTNAGRIAKIRGAAEQILETCGELEQAAAPPGDKAVHDGVAAPPPSVERPVAESEGESARRVAEIVAASVRRSAALRRALAEV